MKPGFYNHLSVCKHVYYPSLCGVYRGIMTEYDTLRRAKAVARSFEGDERGVGDGIGLVVSVFVTALVAAFLVPVAVDELVAVDTSAWSDGATSIWNILDLAIVLGVILVLIKFATNRAEA